MCTINYGKFEILHPKVDYAEENFTKGAFAQLLKYFEDQQLCDVVLIAGEDGIRVPAHRVVLSASSLYFSTMFMGSLPETTGEVKLGELNGGILQKLVRYCYTGALQIEEDNVDELLASASLLQIAGVEEFCCDFLARRINIDNWVDMFKLAERYDYKKLLDKVEDFGCAFFPNACRHKTLQELDAETLGRFIASDKINVSSEEMVFRAVVSWIKHDEPNRAKYTEELLSQVRLPRTTIAETLRHLSMDIDPTFTSMAPATARPRVSTSQCVLIGGIAGQNLEFEKYCPMVDKWENWDLKANKTSKMGCRASLLGETIVICGGDPAHPDETWLVHVKGKTVERDVTKLNESRCLFGMVTVGYFTYVIGGTDGRHFIKSMERLSLSSRKWSYVSPMSVARINHGVAVLDGHIYVVGGANEEGTQLRSMEVYDSNKNTWTFKASLTRDCKYFGLAAGDGYLYIAGGHSGDQPTNIVERYNPKTDCWLLIASLPDARMSLGCAFVNNRLLAIGGFNDFRAATVVDEYDPELDQWTRKNTLMKASTLSCILVVPHHMAVYSTAPRILSRNCLDLQLMYREAVQSGTLEALVEESVRAHRAKRNKPVSALELFLK